MELHEHDIEQLEEVLEPVEDPDLLNTNLVSASSDTPPIMRPFVNSIFPVLLINKEFLILLQIEPAITFLPDILDFRIICFLMYLVKALGQKP